MRCMTRIVRCTAICLYFVTLAIVRSTILICVIRSCRRLCGKALRTLRRVHPVQHIVFETVSEMRILVRHKAQRSDWLFSLCNGTGTAVIATTVEGKLWDPLNLMSIVVDAHYIPPIK